MDCLPLPAHLSEPPSVFAAVELAGPLPMQRAWSSLAREEMIECGRALVGHTVEAHFALADLLVEVCRRAGERPSERGRALSEFAPEVGISAAEARAHVRVARAWPVERRPLHPGRSWSWYRVLTERTAAEGDTPEERRERIAALAAEADDRGLNVSGTARMIEETLRPHNRPPLEVAVAHLHAGLVLRWLKSDPNLPQETLGRLGEMARVHFAERLGDLESQGLRIVRA